MRKFLTAAVAFAASVSLLAGCSGAATEEATKTDSGNAPAAATFPVTIKHAQGELKIEKAPEKIVVMDMAVLDTLDTIGAGDKVVGTVTKSLPSWLKDKYSKVENAGSLKEPDMEAIAKMQPDLVIVAGRSSAKYSELQSHFPTIDANVSWKDDGNYSEKVIENVKMLGQATGHVSEADAAAKKISDFIAAHKDSAKDKGTALVVMTNAGELSLHGPKSRWAPIYDVFGFKPAFDEKADEGHRGQKVSFETIKEINPDYMFVVDRDIAVGKVEPGKAAKEVMNNELINETKAAKNGKIFYLDSPRWYIVMTGASNYLVELEEIAKDIK